MFETKVLFVNLMYVPFLSLIAWLQLDKEAVQILCYLLIIDYLVGSIKALKFNTFKYKILVSGIFAKAVILIIPITLAFMFKGIKLFDLFGGYVNTIISLLIIAEAISILFNVIAIKTGEDIEKPDFVNVVAHKIRIFIEKIFVIFS